MALFNRDMDRRLRDLTAALDSQRSVSVAFRAKHGSSKGPGVAQPDRVEVSFDDRVLVFGLEMAEAVAAQLNENGHEGVAKQIWGVIPGLK